MKMKKGMCLVIILLIICVHATANEFNAEVVDRTISYNVSPVKHYYPIISFNDVTYISVRDVAQLLSRNIRWEEKYNTIYLDSKKEQAIQKKETAEKIGKAIIEEFYNKNLTRMTVYHVDNVGKPLTNDDSFALSVIFELKDKVEIDSMYMLQNCDVRVDINATDGHISVFERQDDGELKEFSLIELSQRNAIE